MSLIHTSFLFTWSHLLWLWALAKAHPAVTAPIVGALLTQLLKPRTSAQYLTLASRNPTWLFTRVAAMLQLIAVVFPDPVKARAVVLKVILGTQSVDKLPDVLETKSRRHSPPS